MGLLRLLTAAPYLLFAIHVFFVFPITDDDSYITLRYAVNFASGHGAVYNIGERVEGFTSCLHMLMEAGLYSLFPHVDPLFTGKLFSIFFGLLTLWMTRRIAKQAGLTDLGAVIAQLVLSISVSFAVSSVNALETTLNSFILTWALLLLVKELDAKVDRPGYLSGFLLFVATLARPEVMLIFALLLIGRVAASRFGYVAAGSLVKWACAYLLPFGLMIAGRLAYYHQIFPNTYYAKTVTLRYGLSHGLIYLLGKYPLIHQFDVRLGLMHALHAASRIQTFWFVLFPLLFWSLTASGLRAARDKRSVLLVFGLAIAAQVLFILRCGGDWMESWRFVTPILPIATVLQVMNVRQFRRVSRREDDGASTANTRAIGRLPVNVPSTAFAMLVVCMVALQFFVRHPSWASVGFTTDGARLLQYSNFGRLEVDLGDTVRDVIPHGASIACTEAGYVGYVNRDKPLLDLKGLVSRDIAHLPSPHTMFGIDEGLWYAYDNPVSAAVLRSKPDYIVNAFAAPTDPSRILGVYELVASKDTSFQYGQIKCSIMIYKREPLR